MAQPRNTHSTRLLLLYAISSTNTKKLILDPQCLSESISPRFPPVYWVHENTVLKWKRQYKMNPELAFSGQNEGNASGRNGAVEARNPGTFPHHISSAREKATKSSL